MTGDVVDVAAGGDANSANLRRECVGQIIAVQIRRGNHVEFVGPRQHLLECDVRNGVLDNNPRARLPVWNPAPWTAVDFNGPEELLGDLVSPVAKRAFGELHDVALVDQRDISPFRRDGVTNGAVYQALGAQITDWLQSDADLHRRHPVWGANLLQHPLPACAGFGASEPDLLELLRELLGEEVEDLLRFRRAGRVLDTGVNVFRVLAEDHHVHFFWMFDR